MSSTNAPAVTTPGYARAKRTILAMVTALAFVLIVLPATASAVTKTWQGDVDGNWATAGNWDTGSAPTNADLAVINNTSDANLFPDPTVSTAGQTADAVTLSGSRVLNIENLGALVVDNQITAPVGTNVNLSGGDLSFATLQVDVAAGLSLTDGQITGTLQATAPTTLNNTAMTVDYGVADGDAVTLGTNVNMIQTGDASMGDSNVLNIGNHLYTLVGTSLTKTGFTTAATINISAGGRLLHTGATGGVVNPQINSSGTLEDDGGVANLAFVSSTSFNQNQLGGTLKTTGSGLIDLDPGGFGGGDSWTLKSGGVAVDNPSGTVRYNGFDDFDTLNLNGQTISLVNGSFTHAGPGLIVGTGTIDSVPPLGGQFLIDSAGFGPGADVTIPSDTTANVVGTSTWPYTFNFNVNGTLVLSGTSITTLAPDQTPRINISSSGLLTHTGGNTALVEPRVVSTNGTIEDNSSGALLLERVGVPGQINLYSGTMRTTNGDAEILLGTEVHGLSGPLTMDATSGGRVQTAPGADLQLNVLTLTLLGDALLHGNGTISGTGTINGPGMMRVQGGNFDTGGVTTVNAPTIQTASTNVAGDASELRIGGTWLSNNNITYSGTGGTFINVLSSGILSHTIGTFAVAAPLTVSGLLDLTGGNWDISGGTTINPSGQVSANGGLLDLNPLTNQSGTTLTDGTYTVGNTGTLRLQAAVDILDADLTIDGGGLLLDATDAPALADLGVIGSNGSLTLTNGHTEDVSDGGLEVDGTLAGNGTIVADVFNFGIVSPGTSVGELDISGDYNQLSSGTLEIEVDGVGVGEFDILDVDGDIDLDGDLALLPSAAFVDDAQPGDRAAFLRYTGTRLGPDPFDTTTVDPPLSNQKAFTADYVDPGKRVDALVGPEPPDVTAPGVTITKKKISQERRDAKFKFTATEAGSTFECKLDKRPWRTCTSPRNYGDLDPGKHKFRVRATDTSGNTSAPAKKKFKIRA